MRLRRVLTGAFWILLYLLLVLAPIGFMMLEPRPQGREFWREFSVALGFVGYGTGGIYPGQSQRGGRTATVHFLDDEVRDDDPAICPHSPHQVRKPAIRQ